MSVGLSHRPEVIARLAAAERSCPDPVGYLTESPGFSTLVRDEGAVYHAYFDDLTRIGVPDGLLRNLDWAPKGRDEDEAWQLWIRRLDEYESD